MAKKYLVLGSCRVVNTIAYEVDSSCLLNRDDLWFTHYPDEHIQKMRHLFCGDLIPAEHKNLFVRYEQQSHYDPASPLRVGESLLTGSTSLQNMGPDAVLNVVVELPTLRFIKIPMGDRPMWGHISNLDVIRASPFNQVGGFYDDEKFLEKLAEFERVTIESLSAAKIVKSMNFVYVPHNPFIELKDGGWGVSEERVRIYGLIIRHCSQSGNSSEAPVSRCYLNVKSMIESNGGVAAMLDDQNHYSTNGRKVAFRYLNELSR